MKDTMWALLGTDEQDGLIAEGNSPDDLRPLVCATKNNLVYLKARAISIADQTGKEIALVQFKIEKVVETYVPRT